MKVKNLLRQKLGDKVLENVGLWLNNLDEVAAFPNSNQEN
jgi:hypothetical protein